MKWLDTNGNLVRNVGNSPIGKIRILKCHKSFTILSDPIKGHSTYTISISQHQNISRWRPKSTDNANRKRNIEIRNSQRTQNEASTVFEIPILSDDLDARHHRDWSESRVVAVNRIPHATPNFLRAACLCGAYHSYHSNPIAAVEKSRKHEKLESRSVHNLPLAVAGLWFDWVGWEICFYLRGQHLTPRHRVWVGVRRHRYSSHKFLLDRRFNLFAFLEQIVEGVGGKSVLPHKNPRVVCVIILKVRKVKSVSATRQHLAWRLTLTSS